MEPTEKLSSAARDWVQEQGSRATTVQEVLEGPDVAVMRGIQAGIDKANKQAVSNAQRIQKWMIIPKDFRWVIIHDHHTTIITFSGHPYLIQVLYAESLIFAFMLQPSWRRTGTHYESEKAGCHQEI